MKRKLKRRRPAKRPLRLRVLILRLNSARNRYRPPDLSGYRITCEIVLDWVRTVEYALKPQQRGSFSNMMTVLPDSDIVWGLRGTSRGQGYHPATGD